MFDLKYKIEIKQQESNYDPVIFVYIDGFEYNNILNITEFFNIKDSGKHELIICSCGDFECGGFYVDVEISPLFWRFTNKYNRFNRDEYEGSINITASIDAINNLKIDILKSIKDYVNQNTVKRMNCGIVGKDVKDLKWK